MTLTVQHRATKREDRANAGAARPATAFDAHAPDLIAAQVLGWYDAHRRSLPWRFSPGERADPYLVWLSEIMLQQTTVKTVIPYFEKFRARWPDVTSLAGAPLDDVLSAWAGLGYYARARNLHRCAQEVAGQWGGEFPGSEALLRTLPGIGDYTAAALAAIAFGQQATPVDGNIERFVARFFAVSDALPAAKPHIRSLAQKITPAQRSGDFAQALMDLGATICTPRNPACGICPLCEPCAARRGGDPEAFPQKKKKISGALRQGIAFVVCRGDGAVLLRTRPSHGLLGGMSEVPTSDWTEAFDLAAAIGQAPRIVSVKNSGWRRTPGSVRHVFTHFPLELLVYVADAPLRARPPAGARWVAPDRLDEQALPSVMRKVIAHAMGVDRA